MCEVNLIYLFFSENIDEDLQASKKIVDDIQSKESHTKNSHEEPNKEKRYSNHDDKSKEVVYGSILRDPEQNKATEADEKIWELKNITENKAKINNWPDLNHNDRLYGVPRSNYKQDYFPEDPSPIKLQPLPVAINRNQHRQFEYRVVTDRPFVHSKTPKAYIAVSLIAPKPMEPQEDDFFLENELRQLKPWPMRQEYQEADHIQPRWIKKAQQRNDKKTSP